MTQTFENTKVFNNNDTLVDGWYWLIPSNKVKKGRVKPVTFFGEKLIVYRGQDGQARAMSAFCPHMGASLAEGKVDGNSIRCLFHDWKFAGDGTCQEIPCLDKPIAVKRIPTFTVEERFGLVWLWSGKGEPAPFPRVHELGLEGVDTKLGRPFVKNCHPNVMMINAIDAQHFNTVHPMVKQLAGGVKFEEIVHSPHNIEFRNTNPVQEKGAINALFRPFYDGPLTYELSYWFASTGTVTIGPDFFHFYIMFALRPTPDGKSEGMTILFTKKRSGVLGTLFNQVILEATKIVGNYFARGDTQIFRTIRFRLATPVAEDRPIMRFIQHAEKQATSRFDEYAAESKGRSHG